ncbi:nosL protein [Advenella faeciporci]|uniref:NosL protein n=1 Tax=Advenella faeciporci TaxID=797535 RepID=A0A918JIQ7_9BURK|nr:nitrous oxide reductase accessory protein NosL [Advenella faeciporci]GGW82862.1 nosL protein [Advenella faeciporci]
MKRLLFSGILLVSALLAGCGNDSGQSENPPAPLAVTSDAIGHYCSMGMLEHAGPKGQIFVRGSDKPVWFSTIQQVFAYTLLPEEPKGLSALYVNDAGAVSDWNQPGANEHWIDARKAFYVIESRFVGGMGVEDAMPFSDEAKARNFVEKHGGRIVTFSTMPEDYILNYDGVIRAPVTGSPLPNGANK